MKTHKITLVLSLLIRILLLSIICNRQLNATTTDTINGLSIISTQTQKYSVASMDPPIIVEIIAPRISFEKTVRDLGDVGRGTKNTCEFRFTNTGRGLLKIDKFSRTCGCTVFHLHKKQYTPNEIIHSFQPAYKRPFLWPCGRRQPSLHI